MDTIISFLNVEEMLSFASLTMLDLCLLLIDFIILRDIPSIPSFFRDFMIKAH